MKALIAAAALAAALIPSTGQAATLAECSGSAPTRGPGIIPNTALAGSCTYIFHSGGVQTVTVRLEPGIGFAGTLQATIHKLPSAVTGMGLKGLFAGSILLTGDQEATFQIDAGPWRFEVLAGHVAPCEPSNTPPPVSHCHQRVGALGSFGGTVTNAA